MSFKGAVDAVLRRTTGYRLTRESVEERRVTLADERQALRRRRRRLRARAARLRLREDRLLRREQRIRARVARLQVRAARLRAWDERLRERRASLDEARARAAELPPHFDPAMQATMRRVRPRTMTSPDKLAGLIEATRYVVRQGIPGAVVECGVWRGGSMQAVAWTLLAEGDSGRELHLFDTFEGMPPPTAEDTRTTAGGAVTAAELLAVSAKDSRMWAIADLDDVRRGMAETDYPGELVHYHPGLVEETTPGQAPAVIAILRLDTDWWQSTRHELDVLYDRLSPGGVLIIDDYHDWDGARKATDEWLVDTGEPLFLAPMGSGRIAIKPFPGERR